MPPADAPLFEERQGWCRPRLLTALILTLALGMISMAIAGVRWHWGWLGAALFGLAMIAAATLAQSALVIRVAKGRLIIRSPMPGLGLVLPARKIATSELCAVLPRAKISTLPTPHGGPPGHVYLMGSLSAVELKLTDGRAVLLGSRRPRDLLAALEKAKSEAHTN